MIKLGRHPPDRGRTMRELRAPTAAAEAEKEREREVNRSQERLLIHVALYMLGLFTGGGLVTLGQEGYSNGFYALAIASGVTFYIVCAQESE